MCEKRNAAAASSSATTTACLSSADTVLTQSQREKKPLPKCYPKWRGKPVYDGNPEALAWTLTSAALSMQYVGAGAFLATAIIRVAEDAAICRSENNDTATGDINIDELCGPSPGSMNPSSLLTLYAMVVSFIAALTLPVIGAIVDYTRHRLLIGRAMSFLFTVFLFPLMFLTEDNYLIIVVCHGCTVFFGSFVASLQFAYLPELTDSELQLADWTKKITIWTYLGMVVYLLGVIVVVVIIGKTGDDIFTSRVGMGVAFVVNAIALQVSWWVLFDKREPLHERPENSSLCTVGFKQLYNTGQHIVRNYRSLKWFYLSICFSDASWQAFGIIIISYLTDLMEFTSTEIGITITISLLGSIPGAMIATYVSRRLDPIRSSKINLVLMIVDIAVFVTFLTGPGQQLRTYLMFGFIGLSGGWKYTMDRLIISSIIPEGQDTELMGLFLFSGTCIVWLPLMIFTIMNESDISPRISVATLIVFIIISLIFLCMVGTYVNARAEVNRKSVYLADGLQIDVPAATAEASAVIAAPEESTDAEDTEDKDAPQSVVSLDVSERSTAQ